MERDKFTYKILFTAHGALLGESGNTAPGDVATGEYGPIYPEFSARTFESLLWQLQELQRNESKGDGISKSLDLLHRVEILWDEKVKMIDPVKEGKHDSIWQFTTPDSEKEFHNDLLSIGKIIRENEN